MGNPSYMPELDENPATSLVDCVSHLLPTSYLYCRVYARCMHIAHPLRANLRTFGDNNASRGPVSVISDHQRDRDVGIPCTATGHRRHYYAVCQHEIAHPIL